MTRITKEPEERREEIISAAEKLFHEKGFENTMMSDIAQALGISQGLPYRYFKSKVEILDAIADKYSHEFLQMIQGITFGPDLNAKDKLDIYFKHIVECVMGLKLIPLLHEKSNEELHHRVTEKSIQSMFPLLRDLIIEGNRQGCFSCPKPEESAWFLLNGLNGVQGSAPINYMEGNEKMYEGMKHILMMFYRVLGVKEE
ncbi:TetR/AcrR family transcriptional regulator [Pseudoclostridium thermosuccinogenes]|jgi:AcrR family transcriptional regulator|uniref:TetR/AcrR family transcriptional regulator n=1 Tax=Clostridium thermosuccinogenes TaxID=84032 RepID=UPI002FD92729